MEDLSKQKYCHDSMTSSSLHSRGEQPQDTERKLVITSEVLDGCLYGKSALQLIGKEQNERKRKTDENDEYDRKIKSIWCEECCKHIQGKCEIHNSKLTHTYAVKSFPAEVLLCTSSIPGYKYGACAGKVIPRGTWIGPYEGKAVHLKNIDQVQDNVYAWEIYKNGKFSHFLDGSDESKSSWMRFIRSARHKNEQNMGAFQYGENIYYKALQDIGISEEILVWYDHTYAQFWGVPFAIKHEVKVGSKGTPKDLPFVAHHHDALSDAVNRPPTTSPQSISPTFPQRPAQPVVPSHSTTKQPPRQRSPQSLTPSYSTKQPAPFTPVLHYQDPRSFEVPPPLQSPPTTVSSPYQVPPHLSSFPILSQQPRFQGTRGQPMPYVPKPPQGYQNTPHRTPPNNKQSRTVMARVDYVPLMSPVTTLPTTSHWSPTEVKENMPTSGWRSNTELQLKATSNSQKSSPLQSLSSSVNTTSSPGPALQSETNNQVSSTVETKGVEQPDSYWKCGQCDKTFSQRLTLQMHVCSRAPEKPFQCGRCPLSFADPSQLRDHVITHTNDRPFKCGFCGRSFAGATTLNNHMRMHTGEKPFSCEQCGAMFAIGTQLSRHLKFGDCQPKDKQWNNSTTSIGVVQES